MKYKKDDVIHILEDMEDLEQLKIVIELLDNLSNKLYNDGYIKESNTLTTCLLSIKELEEKC